MSKSDCNQSIHGILLVNKPQGLTSNAVLQKVKRLYKAKKAGHTGSLDPLATGMLPICFGEATKVCQYLLDADKSYQATGLLGLQTNTGDALGEIINECKNFTIDTKQLQAAIDQFIGPIQQIPSMFSALKHQGTPLYKLAREGITIERKSRSITIHSIELLHFDGQQFTIKVCCSKGTYIRSLVEDIGQKLRVYAHVTQLHRIYTTGFDNEKMYSLTELSDKDPAALLNCLLPLERAINYMPVIVIDTNDVNSLRQGKTLVYQQNPEITGCVRLHDTQGNFIGLAELNRDRLLKVRRLMGYVQ